MNRGTNFRSYLHRRRKTPDYEGYFVDDVCRDHEFPNALSWAEVEDYLRKCDAPHEAIDAAWRLWKEFQMARDAPVD